MILSKEYSGYKVKTGDESIDTCDEKGMLDLTAEELVSAINAENLTDQIFARVLKARTKMHERLTAKLAGEE